MEDMETAEPDSTTVNSKVQSFQMHKRFFKIETDPSRGDAEDLLLD